MVGLHASPRLRDHDFKELVVDNAVMSESCLDLLTELFNIDDMNAHSVKKTYMR